MYAVVDCGSKQYRVEVGGRLQVDRLAGEVGSELVIDKVLLVGGDDIKIGTPNVEGATVSATIVSHDRGDKVTTYKYTRRHRTRRQVGFRSSLTTLEITGINA